jgi:hypothetical protein
MKSCLLVAMATFFMFSGTANAEWSKVASLPSPSATVDYYYDPATIVTANGRKYVWHIMDNSGFFGKEFGASTRFILAYRCGDYNAWIKLDPKNKRNPDDMHQYKSLGLIAYSGRMGSGTIIRDTTKSVNEAREEDMSVGAPNQFIHAARAVSRLVCKLS